MSQLIVDRSPNTEGVRVQARDCVADLIAAIDSGRVKHKQISKEIEDFSLEDLGCLSEELFLYYLRRFSVPRRLCCNGSFRAQKYEVP